MSRKLIGSLLASIWMSATGLSADELPPSPVVVELFTSQGCSSCPPADALIHELAKRGDVVPLSLHVDYWDYIGWKDSFAQPAFTKRQKAYAHAGQRRSIYTPQVIIQGRDALVGHDAMNIVMAIDKRKNGPRRAAIEILADDPSTSSVTVRLVPMSSALAKSILQLVRYVPEETVKIRSGENAGRTISYANVVTAWDRVGKWDGEETEVEIPVPGPEHALLILQSEGYSDILAAARLK